MNSKSIDAAMRIVSGYSKLERAPRRLRQIIGDIVQENRSRGIILEDSTEGRQLLRQLLKLIIDNEIFIFRRTNKKSDIEQTGLLFEFSSKEQIAASLSVDLSMLKDLLLDLKSDGKLSKFYMAHMNLTKLERTRVEKTDARLKISSTNERRGLFIAMAKTRNSLLIKTSATKKSSWSKSPTAKKASSMRIGLSHAGFEKGKSKNQANPVRKEKIKKYPAKVYENEDLLKDQLSKIVNHEMELNQIRDGIRVSSDFQLADMLHVDDPLQIHKWLFELVREGKISSLYLHLRNERLKIVEKAAIQTASETEAEVDEQGLKN